MMKEIGKIDKCIGCGLCSVFDEKVELKIDSKGFIRPFFNDRIDTKFLKSICPLTTNSQPYSSNIWGTFENVYLGASTDTRIRNKASSGGVITQILIYLLETKRIDGVIHTGASDSDPIENNVYLSTTKEEVISNAGSRYAPAAPLSNIKSFLKLDKKYAFVGKPCDVRALRNYEKISNEVTRKIPYMLSFFCAGTPSYHATSKVISSLEVEKDEVKEFRYRGNGWPGYATAITKSGESSSMTYDDSWGNILGKDVQPYCRWCADGVGEFADISCGDAWYLNEDGSPDFREYEGRNVIFSRNNKGEELLKSVSSQGYISLENFREELHTLKNMQHYQYERKETMVGKILALKIMFKSTPPYKLTDLLRWAKGASLKKNGRVFVGTVKRVLQRKI